MALNVKFLKGSSVGYAGLETKNPETFYLTTDDNNLYLGEVKLSNGADLAAAVERIAKNEEDIADIVEQLGILTGDAEGSISKMISDALGQLPTQVATLIGEDAGKSVRTIANEELAKQLIAEGAAESLDSLQEIAAWIQSHPGDAAAMNKAIEDLTALVGTLPEDITATDVVGYIAEAVAAEKARAEGIEGGLDTRLQAVEAAVGEGGAVADQISAAIGELDADIKSAEVETGKGIQVQVAEVDGKLTSVTVTGNFNESYDVKGAASAAQAAAEATAAADAISKANTAKSEAISEAAADATTKAGNAETNAKKHADDLNTAMDARMQTVEAASTDAVKDVATGTTNGTIKVDGEEVAVAGLGTAAYANLDAFEASGSAAQAEQNAKDYVDEALTWGTF